MRGGRAALALTLLWVAGSARSHGPASVGEGRVVVEEPTLSWVYVGEFRTGDEVFELTLDYDEEGFALPFEILVPHQPALERHRPRFAVVGPGLPAPTAEERAALPREVPPGLGVFLERNDAVPRATLFEGVLRRMYWTSEPVALAVDAGRTEVWIWSPNETVGKFALGLGVEEDFGSDSVADLLARWGDYAY